MNEMTYDDAMQQLDGIIRSLETEEALSMEAYKEKAREAQKLIAFCREQLSGIEEDFKKIVE